MGTEQNKETVRSYAAAYSRGDFEAVAALSDPEAIIHGVLGQGRLREVAMPIWQELHDAFAQHLHVEEMIAEGDIVAVRFAESGVFQKAFRGNAPTGKAYSVVAMEWFRFRNGKILERWGARDSASIMRQAGIG